MASQLMSSICKWIIGRRHVIFIYYFLSGKNIFCYHGPLLILICSCPTILFIYYGKKAVDRNEKKSRKLRKFGFVEYERKINTVQWERKIVLFITRRLPLALLRMSG